MTSAGRSSYSTRASRAAARAASSRLRGDGEQRLAGIVDLVLGEDRVVVEDRADIVLAGNVGGGQHAATTPGAARTAERSSDDDARMRALAAWPKERCSVPGSSGMSST